jgi:type VI secretion system protein ImpC
MRTVLHDPGFQAAESAWRGLDFLLRRIGSDVRVFLLDLTREELAQDLRRGSSVSDSGLHRLLAARDGHVPGDGGWSVLAGIYAFSPAVSDVALLARLGRIAQAAGAPFVAAAAPELLAADSFASPPDPKKWESSGEPAEEIWKALRQMSESRFLGLAAPGFLLRLPYGAATDPTERFSFEESPGEPPHGDYLWGNPVFLVLARLAGGAEIGGLPLHVFEVDGEKRLRPCAETLLPSRVAEAILDRGVMPVVAFAGRDAVRLVRLQSIADPPAPLALQGE